MTCGPDDLGALTLVGSPTLSPDGSRVVAAVQTVEPTTMAYRSRLWALSAHKPAEALTEAGAWSDTAPTYSPGGGRVAFLSTKDGRKQAYLLDSGDAVRPLGPVDGQVVAVAWLDADTVVAVVEHAQHDDTDTPAGSGKPVSVSWLRYKNDGGPGFIEPTHELWTMSIGQAPRPVLRVTGRVGCLTVARGDVVYAVEQRHSDLPVPNVEVRRFNPTTGSDRLVWTCPATVSALVATDLSADVLAVSSAVGGHSVVQPGIWLLDGDGSARPAFPDADVDCERAVLSDSRPQGGTTLAAPVAGTDDIVFVSTVGDDVALFVGNAEDRVPRRLTEEGTSVTDFSSGVDGEVAVCVESPTAPTEVHLVDLAPTNTASPVRISDFMTEWVEQAELLAPERVLVTAADGLELRGLLYRAHGTAAGPLLVRVHGGPHLSFGAAFDLETQALVHAGYSVLLPNVRGSAGRGSEFRAMSVGEWGRADHDDLMTFVDWAVDSGAADAGQLFLAGGSYGGYLANWTLTRTTRFRAAISERSISNLLSKLGTSDNGFTVNKFELGGADLFDDGALTLWDRSPLRHAKSITTPLLLIHGENDQRCPIEQSEQLFVALRRLGRVAKFVRFPAESHGLATGGRPDHRVFRLALILSWLDEHRGAVGA
jgi:dipeptidyl aminopeptidase/acylaminoacyl peptidase